jgi:hypothetical protein
VAGRAKTKTVPRLPAGGLVVCHGGPRGRRWYGAVEWEARRETAKTMDAMHGRETPSTDLRYVRTAQVWWHPEWPGVTGTVWAWEGVAHVPADPPYQAPAQ